MKHMLVDGNLPYLPEEIIANILKRLPVKSLIRFQCVCKYWKNLIKTPSFIDDHLHHFTHQNPSLLIEQADKDHSFYLYLLDCQMQIRKFENEPLVNSLADVCLVGSCNGLLCLIDWNIRPPTPLLWNPATKEIKRLSITLNGFWGRWHFEFGFSPTINDYKIVRFSLEYKIYGVEVYSLNTGSWRNIQFDNIKDVCILSHGVTINGVMFWYCIMHDGDMDTNPTQVIVSFDLETEVFTLIPPPLLRRPSVKLAVYEDKLAIISHPEIRNSQCSIYFEVMKEWGIGSSGGRWSSSSKKIDNFHPFTSYARTIWKSQIICIDFGVPADTSELREDEMENAKLDLGLCVINITPNEYKRFAIPRHVHDLSNVRVYCYSESLVPISNIQH